MTIPIADFLEDLEDSKIQSILVQARRINESSIEFLTEAAPNIMVADHHLARRAAMYAINGGKNDSDIEG